MEGLREIESERERQRQRKRKEADERERLGYRETDTQNTQRETDRHIQTECNLGTNYRMFDMSKAVLEVTDCEGSYALGDGQSFLE